MSESNVRENIKAFLNYRRTPASRYSSFDYCFNYFYRFFERKMTSELASIDNIEKSCLHLAFYLASWGMYRGSSFLLKDTSVKHFEPLIKEMSKLENITYWEIDADNYTEENIALLIKCKEMIVKHLEVGEHKEDTLVTKVMLGVYGNTPAFDRNFKAGIKEEGLSINTFNKKALRKVGEFYQKYKTEFDNEKIPTIDFITGKDTNIMYTKAKLIDMAAFQVGGKINSIDKTD